jgi:WD40 repeat protein
MWPVPAASSLSVSALHFSPDGQLLVVGHDLGPIQLWRVKDGSLLREITTTMHFLPDPVFSPDGRLLAVDIDDTTTGLWQVSDGALLHTLRNAGTLRFLTFSADGQTLISVGGDALVRFWNVRDGKPLRMQQLEAPTPPALWNAAFSADGQLLAGGSEDGTIRIWRTQDGRLVATLQGYAIGNNTLAFSRDGQFLASSGDDILLWRLPAGTLVQTIELPGMLTGPVAFTPDSQTLVWGDNTKISDTSLLGDGPRIHLFQFRDGQLRETAVFQKVLFVESIAVSPDGQVLASAQWEERLHNPTVRLWNLAEK